MRRWRHQRNQRVQRRQAPVELMPRRWGPQPQPQAQGDGWLWWWVVVLFVAYTVAQVVLWDMRGCDERWRSVRIEHVHAGLSVSAAAVNA